MTTPLELITSAAATVLIATAAHGQCMSCALPGPVDVATIEELSSTLSLSPHQHAHVVALHEAYRAHWLEDGHDRRDALAAFEQRGMESARTPREQAVQILHAMRRSRELEKALREEDDRLFAGIDPVLADGQRGAFPAWELARKSEWVEGSLFGGHRSPDPRSIRKKAIADPFLRAEVFEAFVPVLERRLKALQRTRHDALVELRTALDDLADGDIAMEDALGALRAVQVDEVERMREIDARAKADALEVLTFHVDALAQDAAARPIPERIVVGPARPTFIRNLLGGLGTADLKLVKDAVGFTTPEDLAVADTVCRDHRPSRMSRGYWPDLDTALERDQAMATNLLVLADVPALSARATLVHTLVRRMRLRRALPRLGIWHPDVRAIDPIPIALQLGLDLDDPLINGPLLASMAQVDDQLAHTSDVYLPSHANTARIARREPAAPTGTLELRGRGVDEVLDTLLSIWWGDLQAIRSGLPEENHTRFDAVVAAHCWPFVYGPWQDELTDHAAYLARLTMSPDTQAELESALSQQLASAESIQGRMRAILVELVVDADTPSQPTLDQRVQLDALHDELRAGLAQWQSTRRHILQAQDLKIAEVPLPEDLAP